MGSLYVYLNIYIYIYIYITDEFFAVSLTPNQEGSPFSAVLEGLFVILTAAFLTLTTCFEYATLRRAMTLCQGEESFEVILK